MEENVQVIFKGHQYINLETYRKNGAGVRTPVWFAQDGCNIYVWTDGKSGKAKRIRGTAQVKLAPSDARGEVKGPWVSGQAMVAPEGTPEFVTGAGLINRKYGLMKRLFDLFNRGDKTNRVVLLIWL